MPKPAPASTKLPNDGEADLAHFHEGPAAAQRFTDALRTPIGVPPTEMKRREAAWRQKRSAMQQRTVVQQRAMVRQRKGR